MNTGTARSNLPLRRSIGHWLMSESVPGPVDDTHSVATEFFETAVVEIV
jgi:hypothetical protein